MLSEFEKGYNHAIFDVCRIFNGVQNSLQKAHVEMDHDLTMKLMAFILKNRVKLMDGKDRFVQYNNSKKGFEFYGSAES